MLKVYKQNLAENDLIDILIYTYQKWGENQADIYLDELGACSRIDTVAKKS